MAKKDAKQELQKKYLQLQLLKQYAAAMLEEKGKIEGKVTEIAITMNAAENIAGSEEKEFWAPLGSDVYMLSRIEDSKSLLVDVGAGVYVQKNIEESREVLQKRRSEYEEVHQRMEAELHELVKQIEIMEREVQDMASKTE